MNQIDNIMKLVHDMASDREIRTAIEQALTQGEPVYQIWRSSDSCGEFYSWEDVDANEFVTSKARESAKRTLYTTPQPQPKQEPVEWSVYEVDGTIRFAIGNQSFPLDLHPDDEPEMSAADHRQWHMKMLRHALSRLAAPQPQREWVGLTDEAIYGAFRAVGLEAYHHRDAVVQTGYDRRINDFARVIEAKLKEKNHG